MKEKIEKQGQVAALFTRRGSGVVYFYTPMCGTCQMAGKMLSVVEEIMPELTIFKINLNYYSDFSISYEIESVPCLLMLRDGEIKEKIYAFQSVPFLIEKIRSILNCK